MAVIGAIKERKKVIHMAKKDKKQGKKALKFIVTALLSGATFFGLGAILTLINTLNTTFTAILQGVFILLFAMGVRKFRKGKEILDLDTFIKVIAIWVFYLGLARLPFTIPFLSFAVSLSFIGALLSIMAIWFSEGVVQRIIK